MKHPPPPGTRTFIAHCPNCGGDHPHYQTEDDRNDEMRGTGERIAVDVFHWCTNCNHRIDLTRH
jgi:hypothetical protein